MRAAALLAAASFVALAAAACGPSSEGETSPGTQRGPVSLEGQLVELAGPSSLSLSVPSCNGDPELVDIDERERSVHIEVVTTQVVSGPADSCLDALHIDLDRPLDDRDVIDEVSGETLPVTRDLLGDTECFDADYPIEPTFDRPRDALAHAIDVGDVPVPGSVDDYERVERDEGWVDFEFRESDDRTFTWGIMQDEDGRWGMVSLGGCFPVSP